MQCNLSITVIAQQSLLAYYCKATSQPYEDRQIWGVRTPKPLNRLIKKFDVGDYVGDNFPHAKIQNDRPLGASQRMHETSPSRGLFFFPILFCGLKFCLRPETKPQNRF